MTKKNKQKKNKSENTSIYSQPLYNMPSAISDCPKNRNIFDPYQVPNDVLGEDKDGNRANDSFGGGIFGNFNITNDPMLTRFEEGVGFPGYPYLAQLSCRSEYRTIVCTRAQEMTREGISFEFISKDKENEQDVGKIQQIEAEFKRLDILNLLRKHMENDAYFGISHIYIDLKTAQKDAEEKTSPLIISSKKIKKGDLIGLRLVEPIWTTPVMYDTIDPFDEYFYKPSMWWVLGQQIHASRLLTTITNPVPDIMKPSFNFGGVSFAFMCKPYVDNWLRTRQSVSDLIKSFSIMVLKTDLSQLLATGCDDLNSRAAIMAAYRDNRGLQIVDKENEDFTNVSAPLSGLDKLQAQSQEHMATTALTTFGGSILGLLATLKLAKGVLPSIATMTASKGGFLSSAWRGTKIAGQGVWNGIKWIASKGVEAGEWVGEHPIGSGKIGGRLAGAAPMVVWDLTAGNITDAQSTSMWDGVARKDKNGQWDRIGRAKNIERTLNAKILQSTWNDKYYVQTKDGVYVYIDSQFYEPIEQIKKRIENGQRDIPNQPSASITKSISEAIMPSAHAGDLVPYTKGAGGKLDPNAIKTAFNILTTKDENGSFTNEQAKGIIANLMGESGKSLNHNAIGDSGKAYGVAQWHPKRQEDFKKLFGHSIQQSTLEEQIKFLKWEMANTEKVAGDQIKRSRNMSEALVNSVLYYERPQDIQGQSIGRMGNLAYVAAGLEQNNVFPTSPYQRKMQAKQQSVNNNTTHNVTNSPTVNIHVANGTVENVQKAVKQAVDYPSARNFNGLNGMS